MNTTVEALQDLYVAKGGNLEDVENLTTIPGMIEAITELCEEEGTAVTSEDINEIIANVN